MLVVVALVSVVVGLAVGLVVSLRSSGLVQRLSRITGTLERTLGSPSERGTWGEVKLRQVVELAGMEPWCDFEEQVTLRGQDGDSRPDLVVHVPGDRKVVIDAKATLDAKGLRNRMRELAAKRYWEQLPGSLDFVVLFVPLESALSSALQEDRLLLEEAAGRNVMFATPATLLAILRFVAHGWRQEMCARDAAAVREGAEELYSRVGTVLEHMALVGRRLGESVKAYNNLVGSVESRLLPSARRMHEHGVAPRDLDTVPMADVTVRELGVGATEQVPWAYQVPASGGEAQISASTVQSYGAEQAEGRAC
jgi:DNA recombination protein RmuC